MRIVVVGPVYPYRGGIAHHNSSLISALRAQGNDVLALSYKRQYPSFLYPGRSDKDPSKEILDIEAKFIFDPINPFSWKKGLKEIDIFNPEKVIFHWWTSFWAPMYWYLLHKIKHHQFESIAIVHNVFPHEKRFYDHFVSKKILSRFDKIIIHSKKEEEKINQILQGKKVYYFPHPIYDTLNIKLLKRDESRKKLSIKPEIRLFLMFGIIRKYKGLSYMLEAINILVNAGYRNVHLIVAGEFWDPLTKYQQEINDLGIDEYVTLDDRYIPNEEIPILFSAADLFLAPYIEGTQSGAIKLALAYNLPIVSTTIVANENEIDENYWKTVTPDSSVELATAIKEFNPEPLRTSEKFISWNKFSKFITGI